MREIALKSFRSHACREETTGTNFSLRSLSADNARGVHMLKWALIFLVISIVAGLLGFTGISAASAGIAKILFFIAVAIFLVLLMLALFAGAAIV